MFNNVTRHKRTFASRDFTYENWSDSRNRREMSEFPRVCLPAPKVMEPIAEHPRMECRYQIPIFQNPASDLLQRQPTPR
jgi:hypothetical protein